MSDQEQMWICDGASPEYVEAMNKATNESDAFVGKANSRDYRNVVTNTDVRTGFAREDYDYFRENEVVPEKRDEIIKLCTRVYEKVPIVNNFLNLMSEFGSMGIRVVHPNPRIANYYKEWWNLVGGNQVSEQFLSNMYTLGISVLQTNYTSVPSNNLKKLLVKGSVSQVPTSYRFINPLTIKVDEKDKLGPIVGKPKYVQKIPDGLPEAIRNGDAEIIKLVPQDVLNAVKTGNTFIPLPESISIYHYKKRDWELWAKPVSYCVLDDVINYQKMKLADRVALDGSIAKIRVWKLGNLENKIVATDNAVNKFTNLLMNNVGGGFNDIVWTPAIELLETAENSYKFLGEDKYKPLLSAIYTGFGVPSLLSGGGGGGMTNNFIAVKILIERLIFGRRILIDFWNKEFKKVQQAKGFRLPAQLEFDDINLTDEHSILALYIQLWDRGIISDENLRTRFGEETVMEEVRIRRENKQREAGKINPKTGPYFVDKEFELTKIREQKKDVGVAGEGRPQGSRDSKKRKRRPKPLTNKSLASWAETAQAAILETLMPGFESVLGKPVESWDLEDATLACKKVYSVLANLNRDDFSPASITSACSIKYTSDVLNQLYERAKPQSIDSCLKLNISAYLIENGETNV